MEIVEVVQIVFVLVKYQLYSVSEAEISCFHNVSELCIYGFQIRTHKRPTVGITPLFHAHLSASLKKSYANCPSYKGSYVVSR